MTKSYVYFAIKDADGNEHILPPFVIEGKLKTSIAPEKNDVKNTSMNLKLENVDEVRNILTSTKIVNWKLVMK